MKAAISYLFLNTARGSIPMNMPHAICGGSGKTYGMALYNPQFGTHTFEVTQEVYEKGAGLDIANAGHRSLQKWEVRPKISLEMDEHENQLAQDLDLAKGELAQARNTIDVLKGELKTLQDMMDSLLKQRQTVPADGSTVALPTGGAPTATKVIEKAKELSELSYPELKALAKERGLNLGPNPSGKDLKAALAAAPAVP